MSRTKASGPILRPGMSQKPGGASSNFVPTDQIWPVTTLKFVKSVSDINDSRKSPLPPSESCSQQRVAPGVLAPPRYSSQLRVALGVLPPGTAASAWSDSGDGS